jgi:hypothetical protein
MNPQHPRTCKHVYFYEGKFDAVSPATDKLRTITTGLKIPGGQIIDTRITVRCEITGDSFPKITMIPDYNHKTVTIEHRALTDERISVTVEWRREKILAWLRRKKEELLEKTRRNSLYRD